MLSHLLQDETGATAIEYGLIADLARLRHRLRQSRPEPGRHLHDDHRRDGGAVGGLPLSPYSSPIRSAAMKASWGMDTLPYSRIRALPFFCFSRSFFLRVMSPP